VATNHPDNRPLMVARTSPAAKTVEFDLIDLSGGNQYGHMYHAMVNSLRRHFAADGGG
jgi:hypothetical protein